MCEETTRRQHSLCDSGKAFTNARSRGDTWGNVPGVVAAFWTWMHHGGKASFTAKSSGYTWKHLPGVMAAFVRTWMTLAWQGQGLSLLTLGFLGASLARIILLLLPQEEEPTVPRWVDLILLLWAAVLMGLYGLLTLLYRHSVQTIFNANIPLSSQWHESFLTHVMLLKPIEMVWRMLTYRFRVLPDVLVLGEVRCGTTTMCQHLAAIPGCQEPFCLWKHPELDKKETFYFVGHYLGNVNPARYRLCFPLMRFWNSLWSMVLRKPRQRFFTFDGCAQYLTSPSAPHLLAKAYQEAHLPPPVLIVCVRDPLDQATSWWNYEHAAMEWSQSMGLVEANTTLRSQAYPPPSVSAAVDYSHSPPVTKLYQDSEALFDQQHVKDDEKQDDDKATSYTLPPWAMTWPGGQLAGIGRNGLYASNIARYEKVFGQVFGKQQQQADGATHQQQQQQQQQPSSLQYVNVVPLNVAKDHVELDKVLASIVVQINQRNRLIYSGRCNVPELSLSGRKPSSGVHRNAGRKATGGTLPSEEARLVELFQDDTAELERVCRKRFGWKTSKG